MDARLLLGPSFGLGGKLLGRNELLLCFVWMPCPGLFLVCFGNVVD